MTSEKEPTMNTSSFRYETSQRLPVTLTGAEREALRLAVRAIKAALARLTPGRGTAARGV